MEIKRQIVSPSIASKVTYGGRNPFTTITVHQTGNTSRGAGAQTHANLQSNGNARAASWHWSVDDKIAVQSFEHTAQCWAAGDGRGPGNTASVHVEICINSDADYAKSVANGAKLVAKLLADNDLPISAVKQHFDWSRKNCPAQIRAGQAGITWAKFIDMVRGVEVKAPAPKPQTGGTQVEAPKPKPQTKSIAQMADEVIANKHGNGHENRRKSLGISAAEYAKVRDEVNRRAGAPVAKPKPAPTKEYVNLPASAATWRTYKTNVAPVAKNSDWSLTPARFGGLSYEVLARPQSDVVTINTSRGRRNIYVAKSTGATFTRK